jgi:hypothetical protein
MTALILVVFFFSLTGIDTAIFSVQVWSVLCVLIDMLICSLELYNEMIFCCFHRWMLFHLLQHSGRFELVQLITITCADVIDDVLCRCVKEQTRILL